MHAAHLRGVDVVSEQALLMRYLQEMRRIRAVPSTNDEDEIEIWLLLVQRAVRHLVDRILPNLRRVTDRIERRKVLLDILRAERGHHRLLKELPDRLRLLLVHGRLVGQTNLLQVLARVKVRRGGLGVFRHKLLVGEGAW